MTHGAVVLRSSFRDRLIGALRLNPNTYTEVASDDTATGQGAVIITIGGILGVIQLWLNGTWSQVGAALPPIVVVFLAVLGDHRLVACDDPLRWSPRRHRHHAYPGTADTHGLLAT